jgi:tetratricopeptide (TPR) repeat protein
MERSTSTARSGGLSVSAKAMASTSSSRLVIVAAMKLESLWTGRRCSNIPGMCAAAGALFTPVRGPREARLSLLWVWLSGSSCTCSDAPRESLVERPARESYGGLPASVAQPDTLSLLGEIRELVDLESWDALPRARQVTEAEPDAALPWLVLAAAAPSPEEARQATARAAALQDRATEAERLLLAIQQGGEGPEAVAAAEALTQRFLESPEAWLVRSRVHTKRGETEPARRAAERALQLDGSSVSAHALLGESYTFSEPRDLARAEQHYLATTELRPRLGAAWINLGDVYRAGKDLQRARAQYERAVQEDPRNPIGPIKRGHVDTLLGRYAEAREAYEAGLALAPERDRLELGVFRALVSAHEGEPARALAEMDELLARIETSGLPELERRAVRQPLLQDMLLIALHLGEGERAAELLEELRATQLGEPELAYWQARVALAPAPIERHAELVRDGSPRQRQRHHELLGLAAQRQGDLPRAVEHLRQADLETGVMARHHLARALEAQGAAEEARGLYRQIADWGFLSADYALLRAEAETRGRPSP